MPTAPGFADCSYELRHSSMSRTAFVTFGIDNTDTDPTSLATAVMGCFGSTGSLFACLDASVTLIRTRVSLGTDGGEDIVGVNTQPVACTFGGPAAPPNCAVLVHKRTARGGRRGRGRMYLPWAAASTTLTEAGGVSAADVTRVQNSVNAWMAALMAGPGPLVLLHRPSNPGTAHPTTPGVPNNVTSMSVDSLIATQRRRLGR